MVGGMAVLAALLARAFGGEHSVTALTWVGGLALVIGLPLLAIMVARSTARRITTPLADLMEAADALAAGDLSARAPVHGPGQFTQFAASFNNMAEQLEREDRLRRDMAADVAHELRTPLHIIQGNLEGILDGVYAPTPEHVEATLDRDPRPRPAGGRPAHPVAGRGGPVAAGASSRWMWASCWPTPPPASAARRRSRA